LVSLEPAISSTASASLAVALEGIEEGALDAGLSPELACSFCRQALLGSALLMQDTSESPAVLKDRVASPGGTTIAGLAALEDQGVRGTLIRAVEVVVQSAVEGRDK
jgi:pyrroline-5-carboxylate reductase